jgi:FkbM family methyltransferase
MDSLDLISTQKIENFSFKKYNNRGKKLLIFIIILLLFLFISNIYILYFIVYLNKKTNTLNLNYKLFTSLNNTQKISIEANNESIIQEYIIRQKNFCTNPDKFYNQKFEELIKLTNFSFRNISYQMYVYKKSDNYMSNSIIKTAKYEPIHMSNFLDALKYYARKNNIIKNEDIYMLDIGGNLGAYPSFLGKFGYSILTFEASPRNSYIINKNYCHINKYSNIIIINKGLSNEEKICNYYSQIDGIGNGMVLCNENEEKIKALRYNFNKTFEVKLTKLSNFLPYLLNKNIALIKLDIEGGEGKVIEDAIELIRKYHVPFVFSEFNPNFLQRHGTNPKNFIELFTKNGYKISYRGFLNVPYVNLKDKNFIYILI